MAWRSRTRSKEVITKQNSRVIPVFPCTCTYWTKSSLSHILYQDIYHLPPTWSGCDLARPDKRVFVKLQQLSGVVYSCGLCTLPCCCCLVSLTIEEENRRKILSGACAVGAGAELRCRPVHRVAGATSHHGLRYHHSHSHTHTLQEMLFGQLDKYWTCIDRYIRYST